MIDSDSGGSVPSPWYHSDTAAVRFWVHWQPGPPMGAIVSRQLLQYRFDALPDGSDAVAVYEAHREEIDAAVSRRAAAGSREPVMLRESDLSQRPRPPRPT